jgi:uncharacterized protein YndB with AHSA1/START domain
MTHTLHFAVEVDAPAEVTWAAAVDYELQSEWMLGTTVRGTGASEGHAVGDGMQAFTGWGRLGFLDTMEITEWDPPRRYAVRHTGRVVRGTGTMEVEPLPRDRSRFVFTEHVEPPLGPLGAVGFRLVKPLLSRGFEHSLRRFAALVAARHHGGQVRTLRAG